MKTNLCTVYCYILLFYYHRILYALIYFSIKYLKTDNVLQAIFLISYLLSSTLFIISIFEGLNIICVNAEAMDYFNNLDCPMELLDQSHNIKENNLLNNNNILLKFLNLFKNSSIIISLPPELNNSFYIEAQALNSVNNIDYLNETLSDVWRIRYNNAVDKQKIYSYIDIFSDILRDLKSINDNISSKLE